MAKVKIDWDRIANSIAHDATVRGEYSVGDAHCVLGGLAVDYGVELPKGIRNGRRIERLVDFPAALAAATGLDRDQLVQMQDLNDAFFMVELRREALLAWVRIQRSGV